MPYAMRMVIYAVIQPGSIMRPTPVVFIIIVLAAALPPASGSAAKSIVMGESFGMCQSLAGGLLECGVRPSDDTFADNISPTKPMEGSVPLLLIVQDTPSIPAGKDYAFLKFRLSSVLPDVLFSSHARPVNATLWLYADLTTTFYNASVRVYHVDSNDWNETTLTWNNMPDIDMTHYVANQIHAIDAWYEWNVTSILGSELQADGATSFALMSGFKSWMNDVWFNAVEKNVSTAPELDLYFKEPTLTLKTPLPDLPMTIDGTTIQTDQNGIIQVRLPWGIHQLTVPSELPVGVDEKEAFTGWGDNLTTTSREINLGNDLTLNANYQKQYRLTVNSPFGSTNGSGWYFVGQVAHAEVQPASVFTEGVLGLLGVRDVFDHWTGSCTSSQPECQLTINGPGQATAVWREDYTIPLVIGIILVAVIAVALTRKRRRRS